MGKFNKSVLIAKGKVSIEGLDELVDVFQQLTSNKKMASWLLQCALP